MDGAVYTPEDFNEALERNLASRGRRQAANVEKVFSRRQIEQAFLETFELVGGVPRLAIWAADPENYGQFLQLMMKLAPKELAGPVGATVLEYRSNIPASPLNRPASAEIVEEGVFTQE